MDNETLQNSKASYENEFKRLTLEAQQLQQEADNKFRELQKEYEEKMYAINSRIQIIRGAYTALVDLENGKTTLIPENAPVVETVEVPETKLEPLSDGEKEAMAEVTTTTTVEDEVIPEIVDLDAETIVPTATLTPEELEKVKQVTAPVDDVPEYLK